jgi:hypothetical protein
MKLKKVGILWEKSVGRLICTARVEAMERTRGKEDTCRRL